MNSEIERLAKEAGITICPNWGTVLADVHRLAKFAALIAEECAKVCTAMPYSVPKENSGGYAYIHVNNPEDCGRAIRAKFAPSDGEDAAK